MAGYIARNRDNWNDRVPIHVASKFYDVDFSEVAIAEARSLAEESPSGRPRVPLTFTLLAAQPD